MSGEKAVKLKDEGNVLFKRGRFNEALEKYSQGISKFNLIAKNSCIILSFAI